MLDATRRYPGLSVFGLNPGLIQTSIRTNLLGEGSLRHRWVEWVIGRVMMSAEQYAERMTPLLWAKALEGRSGAMFNKNGSPIEASPSLTPQHVDSMIAASEALVSRGLSATS